MQAHVWKFAPSDSAYSRAACRATVAAIMRLSNVAMAYVHINCREWRRLFYHVAPCSFQIEPQNDKITLQLDHYISETYIFPPQCHTATQRARERAVIQKVQPALKGGGTTLQAHKVWVTCSSTRGLNIYLLVTQGSLTVELQQRKGGAIRVESVQAAS